MKTWRPTGQVLRALREGLAVVVRKHKPRQIQYGPARSDADEVFAVVHGRLEFRLDCRWRPAPERAIGVFPRGVAYGIRQEKGFAGPAQVIDIIFRAPAGLPPGLGGRPVLLPAPWWRKFLDLEAACDYDASGQRVLRADELLAFLDNLAKALGLSAPAGRKTAGEGRRRPNAAEGPRRPDAWADWMETWARAEDAIRQRASAGLTARQLADAVSVSPTQLRRVFRAAQGISPKRAITAWRIEEAKKLLAAGRLTAIQVAEQVGYSTVQRFAAAFKEETGKTPGEFARGE